MPRKPKLGKVKCPRCGYEWETSSTHLKISCPYCWYSKVPNPYGKNPKEVKEGEQATR